MTIITRPLLVCALLVPAIAHSKSVIKDVDKVIVEATRSCSGEMCESTPSRTALQLAVLSDDFSKVKNLIARGADPNLADSEGRRPLDLALQPGENHGPVSREVILALLDARANVNKPKEGSNPLLVALRQEREDLFQIILERKPDEMTKNDALCSYAAEAGDEARIKKLMDPAARLSVCPNLLHAFAVHENPKAMRFALENSAPDDLLIGNRPPYAFEAYKLGWARTLFEYRKQRSAGKKRPEPLMDWIISRPGNGPARLWIDWMLDAGADPDASRAPGCSPLVEATRVACMRSSGVVIDVQDASAKSKSVLDARTPTSTQLRQESLFILQTLLEHGANPNLGCDDRTPLQRAIDDDCAEAVVLLRAFGASSKVKGNPSAAVAKALQNKPQRPLKLPPMTEAIEARRLNRLGMESYKSRDYLSARMYFQKAVGIDPGLKTARSNLACVLALEGSSYQALNELRTLMKMDPDFTKNKMRNDRDFDKIRKDPEFHKLLTDGI